MIKVDKLSKSFGSTRAVDDVSFDIRKGEVVGFLGPNGAGKTTTMRLLTHYLVADAGEIRIAGIDIEEDPLTARQHIGYLPESAPLYHDLTVMEYLEYISAIRHLPENHRRVRIEEMVEVCGLKSVLNRNVGVLSKGYRQRVGLAQTMVHDPGILILDEPTTGLDPNQIVEIRRLIQEIGKEKTIIISTHILPEVQATCGRMMIINEGKIVADGTTADLAEKSRAGNMYRVRIRGERISVEDAFSGADFISGFECLEEGEGGLNYEVHGTTAAQDLGEAIFHLAVAKGLVLLELQKEEVSLERIFASLTLGEDAS
jgi:ABC-2 type transport system ATP-binding protein